MDCFVQKLVVNERHNLVFVKGPSSVPSLVLCFGLCFGLGQHQLSRIGMADTHVKPTYLAHNFHTGPYTCIYDGLNVGPPLDHELSISDTLPALTSP